MKLNRHTYYNLLGAFVVLITLFGLVAQAAPNNSLDVIVDQYANNAQGWEGALKGYAQSLFGILVLVDFAWILIRLIIAKFDFTDFFGEIIRQLFFIGFFYLLLEHSTDWANAIVQSFRVSGNAASIAAGGDGGLSPSDIFDSALHIVGTAFTSFQFTFDKFGESLAIVFSAIIIVISFALIAALEIVAMVESYIIIYAGIIFMGFGGSHFTSGFALKTLQYAVSVGAKLFMIQLIVGLGQRMMTDWSNTITAKGPTMESMDMITILGGAIVLLALTKIIPEMVQGMLNGASLATGRSLISSASTAGHMAMAGIAGATAVAAGAIGSGGNSTAQSVSSWASDTAVGHAEEAFRQTSESDSGRIHGYHAFRAEQRGSNRDAMLGSWRSEGYEKGSSEQPNEQSTQDTGADTKEQKTPNLIGPAQ